MRTTAIAMVAAMFCSTGQAQSVDGFLVCTSIENDIGRLSCFDEAAAAIGASPQSNDVACRKMTLRDLMLDIGSLSGECVVTEGSVMSMGEMSILSQGGFDMNGLLLETERLSREERAILLDCQPCNLRVKGVVESVFFQPGLRATEIEIAR